MKRVVIYTVAVLALVGGVGLYAYKFTLAVELGTRSDIARQWNVTQYVRAGVDPYRIALAIMDHRRATEPNAGRLSEIPSRLPPGTELLLGTTAPEATYPPSGIAPLTVTIGQIRDVQLVVTGWAVLNVALLGGLLYLLSRLFAPPAWLPQPAASILLAGAALLFSPTWMVLIAGQFSVGLLLLTLVALYRVKHPIMAGFLLAVALTKPSLIVPFLILFVRQRRFVPILVAAAVHVAAALSVAAACGADAVSMFRDWMAVAKYFMTDLYTLNELFASAGLARSPLATVAAFACAGFAGAVILLRPKCDERFALSLVSASAAYWTYHLPYDHVVLLPALLTLAGWTWRESPTDQRPSAVGPLVAVGVLVLFPVLFSREFVQPDDAWIRGLRWVARGLLPTAILAAAVAVVRSHNRR